MHIRVRNLLAAGSALLLFIGLAFVAVTLTRPARPSVPVQQNWLAAGRPHRVAASADTGRVIDGKFVSDASPAYRGGARPVSRPPGRVPGAVPAVVKAKALKFPVRGTVRETVRALKAPSPARKAGYDPKTSRRLALASADVVTFANADGTKTAFRYAFPVNFRRPDGSWAPISTALVPVGKVPAAAAVVSPSASPLAGQEAWSAALDTPSPSASASGTASPSPSMPPSAPASSPASASPSAGTGSPSPSASRSAAPSSPPSPPGSASASGWREKSEAAPETFAGSAGAGDLVSVPAGAGRAVSFGIAGAAPAAGSASGSTVTYAGVRPGASVSFTAGTGSVKEDIVLSSKSAPTTWVFPLDLKGLRATMAPNGDVDLTDAAGKVVAYVPHGFMSDSKIDPHSGDGAMSYGVRYSLVRSGGRPAIRMTLDTAWLDSSARVWPVTVDPSVKDEGADSSTYVQTGDSGVDNSGSNEIHAGTYDGGSTVSKSFLSFGNVASGLTNDTVLGYGWACSTPGPGAARRARCTCTR